MMDEFKLRLAMAKLLHREIVAFLTLNANDLSSKDQQLLVLECLTYMAESLAVFAGVVKPEAGERAETNE
jgi:hypothetical protein